jgi:hypothetical protein
MEPWHAPAIRQVELLVAQPVVEVRTTTATATTSVPMRTSLGFTMVISEGEGPMEVTAHDDEGNTLDRWVFPDAN